MDSEVAADKARNWQLILGGIIVVVVSVFIYFFARLIIEPLHRIQVAMDEIASSGDFTHRIRLTNADEISKTAQSFDKLTGSVHATLQEVLDSANKLSVAARHLSESSSQVAAVRLSKRCCCFNGGNYKGYVLFDEGCDFLGSTFAQVLELVSMKIFLVALKYWRITGKPNLKQQNSQVT